MLSRRFALVGLPVVVLAAVLLIGTYRFVVLSNLKSSVEAVAASMAQIFANTLWHDYGSLVVDANGMTADLIRSDPRTHVLDREVRKIAAGTRVLKVKVYSVNGTTLYSTDPAQIGSDYSKEKGFQVALAGGAASQLIRRETFQAIAGPRTDIVALESYVSARSPVDPGRVIAVLEIYSDITDLEDGILTRPEAIIAMVVIVTILLAMFGLKLWILRRIERRWLDEQARRIRISAEYAVEIEASRAKSAFLANMSHELRTPLNAIIGFSEMLRTQALGPIGRARYVEYADDINNAGQHLLGVISRVLDLSKIEAGSTDLSLRDIHVGEVLGSALDMIRSGATRKELTLRQAIDSQIPTITSDEGKFRQIVLNIVSNAVKYTDPGGTIDVTAAYDKLGSCLKVTIADTGIGMSEQELVIALTSFGRVPNRLTERESGTGLGLPLAKHMTELLGGALHIKSSPGVGTTVTIALPVAPAEA